MWWSSRHPYIFYPLPPLLSNTVLQEKMKYSQVVELLPSFNRSKIQGAAADNGKMKRKMKMNDSGFDQQVFFMKIKPYQDVKMLPEFFSHKYGASIGEKVVLKDPVGNFVYITVKKEGDEVYLADGWNTLVPFYGLYGGGWVRMCYVSPSRFDIEIYNDKEEQIWYPQMNQHVSNPHYSSGSNVKMGYPLVKAINPALFFKITEKTLDFEEAIGVKLKLCKEFCDAALTKKDEDVTIVDEYYQTYHCQFRRAQADPFFCCITAGWDAFVAAKNLSHGKIIKLGVMAENSRVLYYIPA